MLDLAFISHETANFSISIVDRLEIKKSNKANLENRRITNYLLGLILVLSLLFVGLEYNNRPPAFSEEDDPPEDLFEDMEVLPDIEKNDMIAAAHPTASPAITSQIKAVETTVDLPDQVNQNTDEQNEGNGTPETKTDLPVPPIPPPTPGDDNQPKDFRIVQQLPEYPGGIVAFMKWLQCTLKYPPAAQQQGIQGKVVVSFIVNKDGSITETRVAKAVNPLLDAEALRVVSLMPKWKPGIDNGKPCRTLFAIPIVFKL